MSLYRYASHFDFVVVLTELMIKQEEETAEEADNRSPALEDMSQTAEEEAAMEESITGSPNNVHERLTGPNMAADTGNRPNGISKCFTPM